MEKNVRQECVQEFARRKVFASTCHFCESQKTPMSEQTKQVMRFGTNELKASYKQTGDSAPLPNMITVSHHSFDLASERENKAPVPSLGRVATVLCMCVIAHTSCVIHSRMLLSMSPYLFVAPALPWTPCDLVLDGDLVECSYLFSLFLFDLVSGSATRPLCEKAHVGSQNKAEKFSHEYKRNSCNGAMHAGQRTYTIHWFL